MRYDEALKEIMGRAISQILVTGPQRSGTTIMARCLSHDLGFEYVDENDIGWVGASQNDEDAARALFASSRIFVAQAPALCHIAHELAPHNNQAVVFVLRSVRDIQASQERVGWRYEEAEAAKYERLGTNIVHTKTLNWLQYQHTQVLNAFMVDYESLAGHELWVPKEQREMFGVRQWRVGQ